MARIASVVLEWCVPLPVVSEEEQCSAGGAVAGARGWRRRPVGRTRCDQAKELQRRSGREGDRFERLEPESAAGHAEVDPHPHAQKALHGWVVHYGKAAR